MMTSTLSLVKSEIFEGNQADFYARSDTFFMTIEQLAHCLGYANRNGIEQVVKRNPYLRDSEFSVTDKLSATDGKAYNTRLFTEDGIYEIAFLSKTAIAQLFRAWVRKILKELRKQAQNKSEHLTAGHPLLEQSVYHLQQSMRNTIGCLEKQGYQLGEHEDRIEILEQSMPDIEDYQKLKDFIFVHYIETGHLSNRVDTLEQSNLQAQFIAAQKEIKALKSQAARTERNLKNQIDNKPVITYFADVQALYNDMRENYQSFINTYEIQSKDNTTMADCRAIFRLVNLCNGKLTFRQNKYRPSKMCVLDIVKAERIDNINGNPTLSKYRIFACNSATPIEFQAITKRGL